MSGATPSYRGYRLQALYVLRRILADTAENLIFRPEGVEDLDIYNSGGHLIEVVQVKSYTSLILSNLGSKKKEKPFFKRATELLVAHNNVVPKVVNFGGIGAELRTAWAEQGDQETRERQEVRRKLKASHQLSDEDVALAFQNIQLIPVDEAIVQQEVMTLLQQVAVGIDPENAFSLFMQWIYQLSEKRERATRRQIVAKLNEIGQVLSQRANFVAEWHTSIKPIDESNELDTDLESLRDEFYAGVSTRYSHIQAGLDFLREDKLKAIHAEFQIHNVVVIHGASGQGKTTLALRYLHELYPSSWRYEVEFIDSRLHALSIASALNAQASALNAPIIVYMDVRPNDQDWIELLGQLTRHPTIRVLVTVREEDFRRSSVPKYRIDYGDVALRFDKSEARQIYSRASQHTQTVQANFLTFEDSWEAFNHGQQLLEYVYLLTQTRTLQERIQEQISNILQETAHHEVSDKWDVLRWVAVMSAYEAKLDFAKMKSMVQRPSMFGAQLRQLEEEYLIRVSDDGIYVEGLHPIRSRIIVELLVEDDPNAWIEAVRDAFHALHEADLQPFLLNSFVYRSTSEQSELISIVQQTYPQTWNGNAGVLRSLVWVGVRNYIEDHRDLITQIEGDAQGAWTLVLDLDFVNALDEPYPMDEFLFKNIPETNRQKIETYRASQAPKENALQLAEEWLSSLDSPPSAPATHADWIGYSEIVGWAAQLQCDVEIVDFVPSDELDYLVAHYELEIAGDVLVALYDFDPTRYETIINKHREYIESRLASEYQVWVIERDEYGETDGETRLRIHFLPSPVERRLRVASEFTAAKRGSDNLHTAAIERLDLVGSLFPNYQRYASQGYGFGLGNTIPLPIDSTKKDVKAKYITRHWLIRVNQFTRGICEYSYRPNTWDDFANQLIETRQSVIENINDVQEGLIRFLGSRRGINIVKKHLNLDRWEEAKTKLKRLPKLPKVAVDPWGFSSDTNRSVAQSPTEALGILGVTLGDTQSRSPYLPSAIVSRQYTSYIQSQKDFLANLARWFEQSWGILLVSSAVGRSDSTSPIRQLAEDKATELGIRTDTAQIATRNLWAAVLNVEAYQQQFRSLLQSFVDSELLEAIEAAEKLSIINTWTYWYYFAHKPRQSYSNARRRMLKLAGWEKLAIDRKVSGVIELLKAEGVGEWRLEIIDTKVTWKGNSSLWVLLDVDDALNYYALVELFFQRLSEAFGDRDVSSLEDYLLERHYRYIVAIPSVRGKLLGSLCFAPYFATVLFNDRPLDENPLLLAPSELTDEQANELELELWDDNEVRLANQLATGVHTLRILTAQLGEFDQLPEADLTEAGFAELQRYLEEKNEDLKKALQGFIDAASALLARINGLSSVDFENRQHLVKCVQVLSELNEVLELNENGELALPVPELRRYAQQLDEYVHEVEGMRLAWIGDILDFGEIMD